MTDLVLFLAQAADGERAPSTWLDTVRSGGVIAYIIIALSVAALALVVMHFWQIRRRSLLPPHQVAALERHLQVHDVNGALAYCLDPANDSYLTRIMSAGLLRFQRSAFGAFELKDTLEEAGEEQTARLYRSTDALGVIGAISPLLGLLGTVLGMVGAFESLSRSAAGNSEELAANISLALVTTLLGLILAIPCVALFTFFRNRIDAHASESAAEIERLVLSLEAAGAPADTALRAGSAPMAGMPA
ncbi:MAG: MotA/TolQ/ExbB proton channel family protein [Phycisphaeraceae bacterium]|nr:MotA/TolQ/ExbB proton channel family protein [Phycisphaeraceae bacterium]